MSSAPPPPASTHLPPRVAWAILLALASGFTLSQSFRTVVYAAQIEQVAQVVAPA